MRSLESTLARERRIEDRERTGRASPPQPVLMPNKTPEMSISMTAEFEKASAEPASSHADEFNMAAKAPIDLTPEFERASGAGSGEGEASGSSAQDASPEAKIEIQRRRSARDRTPDAERPTRKTRSNRNQESEGSPSDDPASTGGRRRNRDLDRGR